MNLKPQDTLILLKLIAWNRDTWSYQELAVDLSMSPSEVHAGVNRAHAAQLVDAEKKHPVRSRLEEFLIHGVKYFCPPERGSMTRGMPTCHGAPFVAAAIARSHEPVPVWPTPEGRVRGMSFSPLYRSVPEAAAQDEALYRLLVLIDLIRGGNARERKWAEKELREASETQ